MKSAVAMVISLLLMSGVNSQSNSVLLKEWGGFGTKPGQLKYPTMLAMDSRSNVYVVDQHNHRVQKFDSAGNFILMWGKSGNGEGDFYFPYGIAIDSRDNIYVSDMNNNRVQKFTVEGKFVVSVGAYGSLAGLKG